MAYDPSTGHLVLFGGTGQDTYGDTWTWDGTTWTKQNPATSPSPRARAVMAYDANNGYLVLFGDEYLNDTWTWDGTTWTKQT